MFLKTLLIVYTSDNTGTFFNVVLPLDAKIVAATIGSTAFLAPSALTVPTRRLPPLTIIFSIKISLRNL